MAFFSKQRRKPGLLHERSDGERISVSTSSLLKTSNATMSFAARRRGNKVKGVQFTLAVVGASGTGRTTFVNTLCESEVLGHKVSDEPADAHVEQPVTIKPVNVELEEDGVRIALTVVDTPGFGDNIDNEFAFQEIVGYLERQYDDILAEESRIKRNPRFRDNRVHALLYFIPPTGHSLREMDIELMRRLSPRVNVIPVIGKADSLTPSELKGFKKRIMEDIEHYDIPVYNFPYDIEEDDEDTIQDNSELRALLPFAVIGSDEEVEVDGQLVRARIYPWGIAEVDNPKHSDFSRLRSALLNSHLADLKSLTHDVLYETYRTEKLSRSVHSDVQDSSILPEEMANQSVRLKEEQLRREEEKLREIELRVQREITEKRQQLLAKEESLRNLESRLAAQGSAEFRE
uniref:Septin n=1 Tax=Mycena chlorophos TaxID=658473 RepID=A0ABQ0LA01_MYCCL|nr:septin [Mycena chlorophos]